MCGVGESGTAAPAWFSFSGDKVSALIAFFTHVWCGQAFCNEGMHSIGFSLCLEDESLRLC